MVTHIVRSGGVAWDVRFDVSKDGKVQGCIVFRRPLVTGRVTHHTAIGWPNDWAVRRYILEGARALGLTVPGGLWYRKV